MIKSYRYLLIICVIFASCKSTKSTTSNSSIISMSPKKVINKHYEGEFDNKTISARIKAKYQDRKNSQVFIIKLRLEKDKAIWMTAVIPVVNIPVAKVLITPDRVAYYEKINKTYFDGDFGLLSNFLGTEVDYEKIQNLLLGQPIMNMKDKKYAVDIDQTSYMLEPKKQEELFDLFFWLNPTNFKLDKQEVRQSIDQKRLTISYKEYQKVDNIFFPKIIQVNAVAKAKITLLDLEYRTVEFDKKVSFPFRIPSGYKEIKLDEKK